MHSSNLLNLCKSIFFSKNLLFFLCLIFISTQGQSQEDQNELDSILLKEISALVYLDSITIQPDDSDLNVDSFIMLVLKDESFYTAFRNLRIYEHQFDHDIRFSDRKNKQKDHYIGIHSQTMNQLCRTMHVESYDISPDYINKRGEYKYLTSKIIDRVFYTSGTICADTSSVINYEPESKFESNIEDLKTVIFKPGRDVKVPLLGKKLSIFSKEMRKYYNYTVSKIPYNDNLNYIFEVELKPEYADNNTKTAIRSMITYFDADNFNIIAREYHLKYKTGLYSFDIDIDVNLTKWNNLYLPKKVRYSGYWKLFGRKAERCNFSFTFSNYNI